MNTELNLAVDDLKIISSSGALIKSAGSNVIASDTVVDIAAKDFVSVNAVGTGNGIVSLLADKTIRLRALNGQAILEHVEGKGWTFDGKTIQEIVREELCKLIKCE